MDLVYVVGLKLKHRQEIVRYELRVLVTILLFWSLSFKLNFMGHGTEPELVLPETESTKIGTGEWIQGLGPFIYDDEDSFYLSVVQIGFQTNSHGNGYCAQ